MKKIVPDTSVIIDRRLTNLIERGELVKSKILIPEAVIAELEKQANAGRERGYNGLDELRSLASLAVEKTIELEYIGRRPKLNEIRLAGSGEIDAMIRDLAKEYDAILLTSDEVQAAVAESKGIETQFIPAKEKEISPPTILDFFAEDTMSIHLKDGAIPTAKRGIPGKTKLVQLADKPCTKKELREWAREVVEAARRDPNGFIEIERKGATIVQLGPYRTAIARPPFSDGYEITAVKPVAKVTLEDYGLSKELKERFEKRAEGVLIAGPPGAGKSTFAQSLAEFYESKEKIVKTMESPRDLQVGPGITQYSPLEGDMEKTADILLLVRPEYTIYDEMRSTKDFQVFADMRLAGVGMIGVVHSTEAIDAIQRLVGRVELGMIPSIVDTVIFIREASIEKVYELVFTVKLPTGMTEADLARPVVEVRDFDTKKTEFEIYTFGEQTIVMEVEGREKTALFRLAEERISQELQRYTRGAQVNAEVVSDNAAVVWVPKKFIARVLGKGGRTIDKIEQNLGLHLDVRALEERKEHVRGEEGHEVPVHVEETSKFVTISMDEKHSGRTCKIYLDDKPLFTATISRAGEIKIDRNNSIGQRLLDALDYGEKIRVVLGV